MKSRFGCRVGISDHTPGSDVAVAAVAIGAEVVEKHFIIDRSIGGPDSEFSMTAPEFTAMVKSIRNVEKALGKISYPTDISKIKGRNYSRSLYVAEKMKKGDMKKVLIISTPFFGYPNSIARAFEKLGYECRIDAYDLPVHPFKGWNKWAHKFCSDKEAFETRNYALYNDYIKPVFDSYKPDIVYIYDGSILFDETLDYFRAGGASAGMANAAGSEVSSAHPAKIIIWMYDSVQNPRFARCRSHIDHCDAFFCFEQKDVEMYATEGRKAFFMSVIFATFEALTYG